MKLPVSLDCSFLIAPTFIHKTQHKTSGHLNIKTYFLI